MRSSVFLSLILLAAPALVLEKTVLAADDAAAAPALDPKGVEFFEKNIRPVLSEKCYSCHSEAAGKSKGGLLLDTRDNLKRGGGTGPAIVAGKPDESLLMKALNYSPDLQMPPAGKLSDTQIAAFKAWIQMGAPDPREPKTDPNAKPVLSGLTPKARSWWAFQPVKKVALPDLPAEEMFRDWAKGPVDRFVFAKMASVNLRPSKPASKETLIRRAAYDLTGLPPTPMEVKAFVGDNSPDAWERVVDRLLASPRYGERWGRHWLDSARYSDTRGVQDNNGAGKYEDYRFDSAWTYRDYVIKSLNDDKPYNQFLVEQIAADRLPNIQKNDPRLAALGFLTVGKRFDNPDDTIDERIDTLCKSTMGLTVACARCHDHKFDPIPTADYYALHGVFASLDEPYVKPLLPNEAEDREKVDFALKLSDLQSKNRDAMFGILRDRNTQFYNKAEGYLLISTTNNRDPRRADYIARYGIDPDREREMFNTFRVNQDHPVYGPFAQAARFPADSFAERYAQQMPKILNDPKRPVNPLVAAALKDLQPQSLEDVAKVYGDLYARAKQESDGFFKARMTPGVTTMPVDAAMEQLLQTPFYVPTADEISTADQQFNYFTSRNFFKQGWQVPIDVDESRNRLLFTAMNTLKLVQGDAMPAAMTINDAKNPHNSYIYIRGERFRKGPEVPRQFLEIIAGPNRQPFKDGSGRLELAQAITDPKNPLTARVIVNRVWMHHFGDGFVLSPDDMGNMSVPPSHPELLDYLTTWFIDNGWSLKKLHKLIMMSNTYQEAVDTRFEGEERDPGNRLLWRANLRRLDFEAIRDSMLMLTGKLDGKLGGPPVNITDEPFSYRRSVYGYVDRASVSDLMSQFDFSDPEMANTKRISTIVPQQALFFMNNALSIDVARQVMARKDVADVDNEDRVRAIYNVLFQRSPKQSEIELASDFLGYATQLADKRPAPAPSAAKPKPKLPQLAQKPGNGMGGMNGKNASAAAMGDMSKAMQEMAGNKFAVLKNDGEIIERRPLSPWELYVQGLLLSNEFVYVN